jgi:hypothetical protein
LDAILERDCAALERAVKEVRELSPDGERLALRIIIENEYVEMLRCILALGVDANCMDHDRNWSPALCLFTQLRDCDRAGEEWSRNVLMWKILMEFGVDVDVTMQSGVSVRTMLAKSSCFGVHKAELVEAMPAV